MRGRTCCTVVSARPPRGRFLCQPLARRLGGGQVAVFIGGNALRVECLGLSANFLSTLNSQHSSLDTMRGIYNADFKVDVLPQAALRLHAVNCTQPFQGCITTCLLSILIPTRINWMRCYPCLRSACVVLSGTARSIYTSDSNHPGISKSYDFDTGCICALAEE